MSDSDTANVDGVDNTRAFTTMVIRAWMEKGHEAPFRARLSFETESGSASSAIVTSAPQDVVDAVRDWLANVQAAEKDPDPPSLSNDPEQ